MRPNKYLNRIFKAKAAEYGVKGSDFSSFLPAVPLTREQCLIEECKKQGVSIYIDDTSEQSAGAYAIFRGVASQVELERRLNAKKQITHSMYANVIEFFLLIVTTITLAKSFL